jgi:stage IV sporulation protein FB
VVNRAFSIGRVFGVQVKLHPVFLALVALWSLRAYVEAGLASGLHALVQILMLFSFVLLHELGHSLMAKRLGVEVYDIVLWPLGGMARVGAMPERGRPELLIALAGPAVNLAICAVIWPFASAPSWHLVAAPSLLDFSLMANLVMGTFNLIPAFPMDGGRVVRALLAQRMSHLAATRIAVWLGRVVAVGAAVAALIWLQGSLLVLLIAVFVLVAGRQEEKLAEQREASLAARGELGDPAAHRDLQSSL